MQANQMLWYTFSVVHINRISCQISHLISQQLGKWYAPGFEPKSCQTHSPWLHVQISNICRADHDRAQRGVMSGEAKIMVVPKLIIYSHKMIIDFKGLWKVLEIYANGTVRLPLISVSICENFTDVTLLSETRLSLHGSFSIPNYHFLCDGFLYRKGRKAVVRGLEL